jgi:hypothetical protein
LVGECRARHADHPLTPGLIKASLFAYDQAGHIEKGEGDASKRG